MSETNTVWCARCTKEEVKQGCKHWKVNTLSETIIGHYSFNAFYQAFMECWGVLDKRNCCCCCCCEFPYVRKLNTYAKCLECNKVCTAQYKKNQYPIVLRCGNKTDHLVVVHHDSTIDFRHVFDGKVPRSFCDDCRGSGAVDVPKVVICSGCSGSKGIPCAVCFGSTCPVCNGTGFAKVCETCHGRGYNHSKTEKDKMDCKSCISFTTTST